MQNKSKFKSKALQDAEEYFKNVHMNREQAKIFDELTDILLKNLSENAVPISKESMKGIGWRAIGMWQIDYKRDLLGLTSISHDERLKAITNILDYVKNLLIKDLTNTNYQSLIKNAIQEAIKYYDKKFKNVPYKKLL